MNTSVQNSLNSSLTRRFHRLCQTLARRIESSSRAEFKRRRERLAQHPIGEWLSSVRQPRENQIPFFFRHNDPISVQTARAAQSHSDRIGIHVSRLKRERGHFDDVALRECRFS